MRLPSNRCHYIGVSLNQVTIEAGVSLSQMCHRVRVVVQSGVSFSQGVSLSKELHLVRDFTES